MSASTDTLPYSAIFDDLMRSYVGLRAQMRDEYNSQYEVMMMEKITDGILTIILGRQHIDKGSVPFKGVDD